MLRCLSSTVRRGDHSNKQSAILTDATGVTIPYMANIGMTWVGLAVLLCTLHTVTVDIAKVTGSLAVFSSSLEHLLVFWTTTI